MCGISYIFNKYYTTYLILFRHQTSSVGTAPSLRDSQSCIQLNNVCYIFGGEDDDEVLYNDIFTLTFDLNETDKKFIANWSFIETHGTKPPARTSHSATGYNGQYMIILGGEGYNKSNNNN
jgi:hypothetical protein